MLRLQSVGIAVSHSIDSVGAFDGEVFMKLIIGIFAIFFSLTAEEPKKASSKPIDHSVHLPMDGIRKAESAKADAQILIAESYINGKVLPQDLSQSFYWFSRAAQQGNLSAITFVGLAYWKGLVVDKDDATAFFYFTLAKRFGDHHAAKEARDELLITLDSTQITIAKTMASTWTPLIPLPKGKRLQDRETNHERSPNTPTIIQTNMVPKWDYKTLTHLVLPSQAASLQMGQEGWELIGIVDEFNPDPTLMPNTFAAVFRRQSNLPNNVRFPPWEYKEEMVVFVSEGVGPLSGSDGWEFAAAAKAPSPDRRMPAPLIVVSKRKRQ